MWLFLASEAMFFASLFSAYVMLRAGSLEWPEPIRRLPVARNAAAGRRERGVRRPRIRLIASHALGLTFVVIKMLSDMVDDRQGRHCPRTNLMLACWFTLTGVHALHVLARRDLHRLAGRAVVQHGRRRPRALRLARIEATRRYWLFVDVVWLVIVVGFYVV